MVNRVGDFGLAIGIFLIFFYFGTINFTEIFQVAKNFTDENIKFLGMNLNLITLICIFLFIGAMGKSAQFLLHTWLPDAMEGPTPVSALIHAATMVTAGVFLVVKCSPLFEYSIIALNFVAITGMITAFFAASVALVQNDIKKLLLTQHAANLVICSLQLALVHTMLQCFTYLLMHFLKHFFSWDPDQLFTLLIMNKI